jgi:hypothetical protein
MNLVDSQARPAQTALLEIAQRSPGATLAEVRRLVAPRHHEVLITDVDMKRLSAVLAAAYDREFHDFAELLLLEKLGPRTLQSLALVAEVIHGTPSRFSDPARFSFAHGGKDGYPFPVPLKTYDESISVLRSSLDAAKVGSDDKLKGMERLNRFVRSIELNHAPAAHFQDVIAHENAISKSLGGRSVFDDQPKRRRNSQMKLF